MDPCLILALRTSNKVVNAFLTLVRNRAVFLENFLPIVGIPIEHHHHVKSSSKIEPFGAAFRHSVAATGNRIRKDFFKCTAICQTTSIALKMFEIY